MAILLATTLTLATSSAYDLLNPMDIIATVVFLFLCALIKPIIEGHRLIAFCFVVVDSILMFRQGIGPIGFLLAPLSLIWFADVFSALRGNVGHGGGVINTGTPDWMIAGFGWIVLLIVSGVILRVCLRL